MEIDTASRLLAARHPLHAALSITAAEALQLNVPLPALARGVLDVLIPVHADREPRRRGRPEVALEGRVRLRADG